MLPILQRFYFKHLTFCKVRDKYNLGMIILHYLHSHCSKLGCHIPSELHVDVLYSEASLNVKPSSQPYSTISACISTALILSQVGNGLQPKY